MGALFQSRGWLPIVEAPGYSRHPTSILAMQLLNAFKCNLKELTTKSAWVPRSAVFGMRMPGGWLHRSCDSLAPSVFPSCWVLSAIFFVFPRCFSSLRAFRHRCRRFCELFFVFSVCFFEGLVHMPRNTVNSISASLDPSVPASSPSDESAPSTTSNSTSSSSFTSLPSSVSISAETDSGHLPGCSAVATSDIGGLLGERSGKFYQRYVRQFQRGLFRDQRAVDLYIDFDRVSFIVFSR